MSKDLKREGLVSKHIGLCATCVHAHAITNTKGNTFILCGLSKTNPAFPKYPRLPVVTCSGYSKRQLEKPTDTL